MMGITDIIMAMITYYHRPQMAPIMLMLRQAKAASGRSNTVVLLPSRRAITRRLS